MKHKIRIIILVLFVFTISYILVIINPPKFFVGKLYTNKDFKIQDYKSKIDKDNDKIDDQTDIIINTRTYISTNPKYKSKYYRSGYPDDSYGVCTDVVGYALKNAGYDLRELVNLDILKNKNKYNIDVVDKNIDFRRVTNLLVYFNNSAIKLTTDIKQIKEWQGGDIVIFKNHIGIVSDKRNKNGVPLIIHHANPLQKNYEEDILEKRNDIVGHYRVS